MVKKTILVDMDEVLDDMDRKWVSYLNSRYGTHTRYEDVKEWDMTKAFPGLSRGQVYGAILEEELYRNFEPTEGAAEVLQKLIGEGHDIFVVTNTPYQVAKVKMEEVLFKYYPFLSWEQCIFTSKKQMIRGDVLIDDSPGNLEGGEYVKLLFSAPYNRDYDAEKNGMIRVNSWEEIYAVIEGLFND